MESLRKCIHPYLQLTLCDLSHLLDVKEFFGFKVDGRTLDRTVFVQGPAVADIRLDGKGYRFGLRGGHQNHHRWACEHWSSVSVSEFINCKG